MMPSGIEAEELHVEHVRKPCHRMPVGRVVGRKRPGNSVPGQPRHHHWILCYVERVVVTHEVERQDLPEGQEGEPGEGQADQWFRLEVTCTECVVDSTGVGLVPGRGSASSAGRLFANDAAPIFFRGLAPIRSRHPFRYDVTRSAGRLERFESGRLTLDSCEILPQRSPSAREGSYPDGDARSLHASAVSPVAMEVFLCLLGCSRCGLTPASRVGVAGRSSSHRKATGKPFSTART